MAQRTIIDALVTVKLHRQPKGRMKRDSEGRERIDPEPWSSTGSSSTVSFAAPHTRQQCRCADAYSPT